MKTKFTVKNTYVHGLHTQASQVHPPQEQGRPQMDSYLLIPCGEHILPPVKPVKVTFNKASSATIVPEVCSHLQTTQYEGIIITSLFCPQPCIFR